MKTTSRLLNMVFCCTNWLISQQQFVANSDTRTVSSQWSHYNSISEKRVRIKHWLQPAVARSRDETSGVAFTSCCYNHNSRRAV